MTSEACNSSSMGTSLVFVDVRGNMESKFSQVSAPRTCTVQTHYRKFLLRISEFPPGGGGNGTSLTEDKRPQ
jgi:hypothetical protein